jgi:hypothetical protein
LDPAELIILMNESGDERWELVTPARMTDYYPPEHRRPALVLYERSHAQNAFLIQDQEAARSKYLQGQTS